MKFEKRDVHQGEHVGDVIRSLREEIGWSRKELGDRAGVRPQYIEAFEEYRYSELPGAVYARNFLIHIARVLRINEARLLSVFDSEYSSFPFKKTYTPPKELSMPNMWTPKRVRTLLVFVLLAVALVYVFVELSGLFTPPELIISAPQDNIEVVDTSIEVTGQTDPEVTVTINNAPIDVDDAGAFQATVDLSPGVNTLTITATKKFGQQTSVMRNLLVRPQ